MGRRDRKSKNRKTEEPTMTATNSTNSTNSAAIFCPFDLKDALKAAFASASWDAELKTWKVAESDKAAAEAWVAPRLTKAHDRAREQWEAVMEREARRVVVDVPADVASPFRALFGSARLEADGRMTIDPQKDSLKDVERWMKPEKLERLRAKLAAKKSA